MAKQETTNRAGSAQMAKQKHKSDVTAARHERAKAVGDELNEKSAPARQARDERNEALQKQQLEQREKEIDLAEKEDEGSSKRKLEKPTLLDGKPGSGSGLKPGDWFAPKSNPGAAARVPMQALQPESLQSHGKGILGDKDLDNPPYDTGDPAEVDASPAGSRPEMVDKEAETKKADRATADFKTKDPDNPTVGAGGKKDATASPEPIGSRSRSKTNVSGGSNSGS